MFYVYEWFKKDTNEIIYVGKGTRNRYKVRKHNKLFNEIITAYDCDSRIVKYFETEEEAFNYEFQKVNELKTKGQCICNIYNGGFGGTQESWTEEKRKWYSDHNCMKSEKQRERMSKNNPMKNKVISEKVKSKNQRKVNINGVTYKSVGEACKVYNVSFDTMKVWCTKGINPKKELCRYDDENQKYYSNKRYNIGGCKQIQYKTTIYESVLDIAEELKISKYTIYRWAKKGFDDNGNICKYTNDKRDLTFKPYVAGEEKRKPIIVNGILYNSKKEAEEKLNIKKGGLEPYIKGIRKNNKYICEYVNQQPSHEKSK